MKKITTRLALITTTALTVMAASLSTPSTISAQASIQINGSGATFPQKLYEEWAFAYASVDAGVKINYGGGGSGKGKTDIINGTVDFAGSDAALTDGEAGRKPLVQIPTVAGAVVVIFNVAGVKDLTLDGSTVGKIYGGQISKWNDPAILALNPGAKLPNSPIVVVHRSDGSGTTSIFTNYLTKASPEWVATVKPSAGTTVDWPVDKVKRGLGGSGNPGVAAAVQKTRNAIGYVELEYATSQKISYTKMINAAGKTIDASAASTIEAQLDGVFDKRLAASIQNSKREGAWPIAGYTYIILNKDYADCAKAAKLLSFITWSITSPEGQAIATKRQFATLPAAIVPQVGQAIKSVTCNNGNSVFK